MYFFILQANLNKKRHPLSIFILKTTIQIYLVAKILPFLCFYTEGGSFFEKMKAISFLQKNIPAIHHLKSTPPTKSIQTIHRAVL
jgi:hypothetical protein